MMLKGIKSNLRFSKRFYPSSTPTHPRGMMWLSPCFRNYRFRDKETCPSAGISYFCIISDVDPLFVRRNATSCQLSWPHAFDPSMNPQIPGSQIFHLDISNTMTFHSASDMIHLCPQLESLLFIYPRTSRSISVMSGKPSFTETFNRCRRRLQFIS